jgi:hypothetical protein
MIVKVAGPSVFLKVTRWNENDSTETVHTKDFNISSEELSVLINGIESFNNRYSGPQSDYGLDGISVFLFLND